jgi:hypothetical protein
MSSFMCNLDSHRAPQVIVLTPHTLCLHTLCLCKEHQERVVYNMLSTPEWTTCMEVNVNGLL